MREEIHLISYIKSLYDYNAWANSRILEACAQLTSEQFLAGGGASFDSIQETLVHIMSGQWLWLSRWQGSSPKAVFEPADFVDLPAIQTRWEKIDVDTKKFLDALSAQQLNEMVTYTSTEGEKWAFPLWQLMLHQVNHGTQHRSEAAVMLTHFGHSPRSLDMLYYFSLKTRQ